MLRDQVTTWDTASRQGGREVNADSVAAARDAGAGVVFALADGIGDDIWAADAARVACDVAARTPVLAGPAQAVLAAQRAVRALNTGGDCVLVVAMPDLGGPGYRIAWAGDVRAYSWDGVSLSLVTTDQTMAEYFRARQQPTTARMEHVVTNSVRTTRPDEVGQVDLPTRTTLLLTSDGVHKALSLGTMQALVAEADVSVHDRVATLVETAEILGGQDNATALLVA